MTHWISRNQENITSRIYNLAGVNSFLFMELPEFLKMMDFDTTVFVLQGISTALAIFTNMFLVYLVKTHTKNQIGNYKYLLIIFACFETFYSIVVFVGMPTHFMADQSWLVFTNKGLIGGTRFAVLGPGMYCTLYEIWVGLVVIHFVYRYMVVCREKATYYIDERMSIKVFLLCLYCCHFVYSFVCGMWFCTREQILPVLAAKVRAQFGIEHPEELGYILLRTRDSSGKVSAAGITTILNHYVLVGFSVVIIFYCGISIWLRIQQMGQDQAQAKRHRLQRQMFITLVIQTMVPILFCHIPTLVYLTFPFWDGDFSFGKASMLFSLLTSINKFCDPIIVIVCIREYRRAALKVFKVRCGGVIEPLSSSSQETPQPDPTTKTATTQGYTTHQNDSEISSGDLPQ